MVFGAVLSILMLAADYGFSEMPAILLFSTKQIPWFMFVLAMYMPAACFLRHLDMKFILTASVLLACAAGYDRSIGAFLYASRAVVFYPFFLAGYFTDADRLMKILSRPAVRAVSVLLLAAALLICIYYIDPLYALRPYFTGRNPFSHKIGFLIRFGCYCVSSVMGVCIISAVPSKRMKVITAAGTRTLQVYILHLVFLVILNQSGFFKLIKDSFGPLACGAAVLAVSAALTVLLPAKMLEYPFRQGMNIEVCPLHKDGG